MAGHQQCFLDTFLEQGRPYPGGRRQQEEDEHAEKYEDDKFFSECKASTDAYNREKRFVEQMQKHAESVHGTASGLFAPRPFFERGDSFCSTRAEAGEDLQYEHDRLNVPASRPPRPRLNPEKSWSSAKAENGSGDERSANIACGDACVDGQCFSKDIKKAKKMMAKVEKMTSAGECDCDECTPGDCKCSNCCGSEYGVPKEYYQSMGVRRTAKGRRGKASARAVVLDSDTDTEATGLENSRRPSPPWDALLAFAVVVSGILFLRGIFALFSLFFR
ncbi:hypothetical protein TWF730_007385 [Orbilia blumenaviensis]|uniref:Uncharacterized protein n=1 Tax=Orbilia blumenaviensis TaxID=1796055 RepID=A0AAV9VA73_9PEZI